MERFENIKTVLIRIESVTLPIQECISADTRCSICSFLPNHGTKTVNNTSVRTQMSQTVYSELSEFVVNPVSSLVPGLSATLSFST